jgi:D-arabinose 5-phosphate isomerase GutQ
LDIATFKSAFQLLIRTAKRSVNSINQNPNDLAKFCQILSESRSNNSMVHIVGEGRAGNIGMILGETLKDIGFSVSYQGRTHPIMNEDVILALSGSGWTKFTSAVIEEGIRKKAKILSFCGASYSKVTKLSDASIQIPTGFQSDDSSFSSEKQAPLTPLGSIFELTTMVIGVSVLNGVYRGACTRGFNECASEILNNAEKTFSDLAKEPKLRKFINMLQNYAVLSKNKVFFAGVGLNNFINDMSSSRFSRILKVHSSIDWRFRQKNDLLIAISGSGVSSSVLKVVNLAKQSQMKVMSITSYLLSDLAKKSDKFLLIHGRKYDTDPDEIQITQSEIYLPSFEYSTAVTLDSCVAQIALDLGIAIEPVE